MSLVQRLAFAAVDLVKVDRLIVRAFLTGARGVNGTAQMGRARVEATRNIADQVA